jgi:hypothetical protein
MVFKNGGFLPPFQASAPSRTQGPGGNAFAGLPYAATLHLKLLFFTDSPCPSLLFTGLDGLGGGSMQMGGYVIFNAHAMLFFLPVEIFNVPVPAL